MALLAIGLYEEGRMFIVPCPGAFREEARP